MSSYRVARTIDGADIELNFSNLMRLDGDPSFLPSFLGFLERFSSRRYEERMEREKKVESVAANANENREEEEKVLVDSWRTAVPMETLGDTRISIFLSLPH